MKSKTIVCMLIDDDNDDHDFFQEALKELEFKVKLIQATNGVEALQILNEPDARLPDCIFLDMNMPGMDGQECLQKIKSKERLNKIPVVMYSTSSNKDDIKRSHENGAIDYIIKPASLKTLISVLNKFFNKHF